MQNDTTKQEVDRMLSGGMNQLSPRQLDELLDNAGYKIDKGSCFSYFNKANQISYKARSIGYTHKASGMRYAHVDAPRDTLPQLQEIRRKNFVFESGKIWEL